MNKFVQKVTSHAFLRRVAVLASGSIAGQALLVLSAPILTRLYTPTDLGLLALFMATITVGSVLATLRYETALHLPKSEENACQLLYAGLFLSVLISILIGMGVHLLPMNSLVMLQPYAWLIALGVAAWASYLLLSNMALRRGQEKVVAKTKFYQALIGSLIQILGASLGSISLFFGQTITQSGGVWRLWQKLPKTVKINRNLMFNQLWRFRKFPLISMPSSIANRLGLHLIPFFLTILFSPAIAGFWLVAQKVVGMPMILIGRSLSQIFFAELNHRKRREKNDLHLFYLKVCGLMLLGSLPFFALLYPLAPWLFATVLGETWREGGVYVQILLPMFWLQLAITPVLQTLNAIEKQGTQAVWDAARLAGVIGVFMMAQAQGWSVHTTLQGFCVVFSFCYLMHPFMCLYYLKKEAKHVG